MTNPNADLLEMRRLINELLAEERQVTRLIGEAIARGELPLMYRHRRSEIREALEDAYAAMPHLEARVRATATG